MMIMNELETLVHPSGYSHAVAVIMLIVSQLGSLS